MEDLAGKIAELLNDPEIIDTLKNLKNSAESSNTTQETNSEPEFELPVDIISTVMKFAPILSSINQEDKYTAFLNALKPLLSEQKQKKLEKSAGILKIIKILPLLKSQGFF